MEEEAKQKEEEARCEESMREAAKLEEAKLEEARLEQALVEEATLQEARLEGSTFEKAPLEQAVGQAAEQEEHSQTMELGSKQNSSSLKFSEDEGFGSHFHSTIQCSTCSAIVFLDSCNQNI